MSISEEFYSLACQCGGPEFAELIEDVVIAALTADNQPEHDDPAWKQAFNINRALNRLRAQRAIEKLAAAWKQRR